MCKIIKSTGFSIEISKDEVFRQLDCTSDSAAYGMFEKEYGELLDEVRGFCQPAFYFKECIFPEDLFCGGLFGGDRILCGMYTLGGEVSVRSTAAFLQGDYVKGMLIDAMADSALFAMEKQIAPLLRKFCKEHHTGIESRHYASEEREMPLQKFIFEELEGSKNGFSLSGGYMFEPVKTNAVVFKLTEDEGLFRVGHECGRCGRFSCKMRSLEEITLTILKGDAEYRISLKPGKSVLEILREEKLYTEAPCGGGGRCGKCLVQIKEGVLPATDTEKRKLSEEKILEGFRLSCQAVPQMNLTLLIPERKEEQFYVVAAPEEEKTDKSSYEWGIAVDIGTTTLVMHKVELETGRILDTWTGVNHQNKYGADVISRIKASLEGGGNDLKACICGDLSVGIAKLLGKSANPEGFREVCIAGNTAMFHLLLGYDCYGLSRTPFTPVSLEGENRSLSRLIQKDLPDIPVKLLPGLAPFVGADITAGIYMCDMDVRDEICMLIDVGTNGEMVLGNKKGLLCASAAAGPAFEGGNISCGMGSLPGAIRSVRFTGNEVSVRTIMDEPARGICGTGALDAVAELYRREFIDETGRLEDKFFETGFAVCQSEEGGEIVLTQKDIREIQLAKSALRAGIETLLKEAGICGANVERVFLAGGFGFSMDLEKAFYIGLFPESFEGKIEIVGNSSVGGCIKYLHKKEDGERISAVSKLVREVDLSVNKDFQEFFIEHLEF